MKIILFVLLCVLICSCSRNDLQFADQGYNLAYQDIIEDNDLETQAFSLNNSKDTVLVGKKGTIVRFEANTFESNSDNLKIELIEATKLSDMLLLNAQTVSNNKILSSGGIIYIQAKDENGVVNIREGKNVEIKIPANQIDENMTAFIGSYDENGNMNWDEKNTMSFDTSVAEYNNLIAKGMFEIPFSLFPYRQEYYRMDSLSTKYPTRNGVTKAPMRGYLVSEDRSRFYKKLIEIIESEKYKSTNLATREFAERLYRLQYIDHTYSYDTPGSDGLFEMTSDRYSAYQHKALLIYEANIDKPLWYSDSLVYELIKTFVPKYFEASYWPSYQERCKEQKMYFYNYYKDGMTSLIEIENLGVDLNDENALEQLVQRGMAPEDANRNIQLHFKQQDIISALKDDDRAFIESLDRKEELLKKERAKNQIKYYVITAQELGWINVDLFYEDPSAKEVNMLARINAPSEADFTTVSLILPDQNSIISGWLDDDVYRFTNDDQFYTKLPVGERAIIVAISYKNDTPYLALKELIIDGDESFDLTLSNYSMDEFKSKLEKLNVSSKSREVS